jgi:GTP-binding protein HflX
MSHTKLKAILVEAVFNRKEGDHLAELTELAFVAGYEVIERITQNLDRPHPEYLFGKGKAKEIKGQIKHLGADVVIIENQLESLQLENLRKMWHVEIIDRFELILEIFINRAGTQEAITQIRLAALKKQGGSRHESHRSATARKQLIKKLEKKLELIKRSKDLRRKRRVESGFDLVAIAGYTNAGKSTLMNALTTANVEVSGRMFTTLDTTTRSFDALGRKIIITDTVGFISRLPHVLMNAFFATLREVNTADLILLLIDSNDSVDNIKRKVLASLNTLGAIEADRVALLPVMNKIDIAQKIEDKEKVIEAATSIKPFKISAKKEENIEELKSKILEILETFHFHIKIPNTNEGMSLVSKIHDRTRITEEIFHPNIIELRFETNERIGRHLYNLLVKSPLEIEIANEELLKKQMQKDIVEPEEDKYTLIKTDAGEEFIVFDLQEENKKLSKTSKKKVEDASLRSSLDKNE